jgi:hypothetical protein
LPSASRREQGAVDIAQLEAMPSTNFDKRIILLLDIYMIDIKGPPRWTLS